MTKEEAKAAMTESIRVQIAACAADISERERRIIWDAAKRVYDDAYEVATSDTDE